MSRGLSHATIVGHLGHDPSIRTVGGAEVANFSLAVNRSRKAQDGTREEETMWVRCAAWRVLAGIAEQYLHKGDQVTVTGNLWLREYTGKDGAPKSSLELEVGNLVLPSGRRDATQDAPAGVAPANGPDDEQDLQGDDDDLPF